jgi:hypothetical protein
MTSPSTRRAARGRLFAIVCSGFALAAGIVWPAAIAAQPAPRAGAPSDRQSRATEAASLRDFVAVRSSVDRSAVWIGDRFSFIVDVDCSHGTDILTDDLSRDRLQLQELDVLGVDETREDRGDGRTVYRFTYHLTTYSFEPPTKMIGEMRLRYYVGRPGQRPEDIEPAGEVIVPRSMVVVRSLLPDDTNEARYRSERPPVARAAVFDILQPLGIGLVIVSIVPAVLWAVALQRRWHHRRRRQSTRQLRHDERTSLDDVRALDVEAEAGRREAFARLSALVRRHVTGTWGVSANGLTPAEISSALSAEGKGEISAEATTFLDACEKARFGRSEEVPSVSACRAAIDQAEQLIGLGRS